MRYPIRIALLLLVSSAAVGDTANLLDFELRSLREPETHALSRYEGKPVLVTFFQPDCNWCLRQVRAINSLLKQCDIEAVAIGVSASRADLRKELHRLKPAFPAYEASPALIQDMGGVPATPLTLLGGSTGEFRNWSRGFLAESELVDLMSEAGINRCGDAIAAP